MSDDVAAQRIGCAVCDWVGAIRSRRRREDELHMLVCPTCGRTGTLHEYPVYGTWPSDYDGCPADAPRTGPTT